MKTNTVTIKRITTTEGFERLAVTFTTGQFEITRLCVPGDPAVPCACDAGCSTCGGTQWVET